MSKTNFPLTTAKNRETINRINPVKIAELNPLIRNRFITINNSIPPMDPMMIPKKIDCKIPLRLRFNAFPVIRENMAITIRPVIPKIRAPETAPDNNVNHNSLFFILFYFLIIYTIVSIKLKVKLINLFNSPHLRCKRIWTNFLSLIETP